MDRGAKRAKKDKEDPLVQRRNELILEVADARVAMKEQGNKAVREAAGSWMQALCALCTKLEAANHDELLRKQLPELWEKIVDESVQQNDLVALAMTCRFLREKQKDLGKNLETNVNASRVLEVQKSRKLTPHTLGWFQWVCDTFKVLPRFTGGNLINYAALQGSVEILRWLMEDKGWEPNLYTVGEWAGFGGSVEVLEYLLERGYAFRRGKACEAAARGGCLEALKFLRGLDPPCPWSAYICNEAAQGGHLEVLKWLRAQNPPCPWRRHECRTEAEWSDHTHIVQWIDQQEDDSDVQ